MSQASLKIRRRPWINAGLAVVLALLGVAVFSCRNRDDDAPSAEPPAPVANIEARVHEFCGKCHKYPPAETFPQSAWKVEVEQGYQFFNDAKDLAMAAPPISQVIKYYEDRAPVELPAAKITRSASPLPFKFKQTRYPVPLKASPPAISNVNLVHLFDKKRLNVLACDMYHGLVMALSPYEPSPKWRILAKVSHPAHAEVVDLEGNGKKGILVANLGSFEPTDNQCGSVVWLRPTDAGGFTPITLLNDVGRVADVQAWDFRGNGKKDLVAGVFGWRNTGEILYLDNKTTDWSRPKFVPRVLDKRHGTIHVPVVPNGIDGRGKPDFVALISQEHETVVAFVNKGNGEFDKKTIYTAPHPAYGSSGIQLVDFDGKGQFDVLYSNGDILDRPFLLKPYHGIQVLRNHGGFPFEHVPIEPMYGVHRAVAADFTGKGRKDIVAVSFLPVEHFPRRAEQKLDSIVLLEQTAEGKYERHSLEVGTCDHVTCAAGDIFNTGRTDLVVGQFCSMKCNYAITIWKNEGPTK